MRLREYTDGQIAEIVVQKDSGKTYDQIAASFNKKYGTDKTPEAIRHALRNWGSVVEVTDSAARVRLLKDVARTRRNNAYTARQNRELLDVLNLKDDLLDRISLAIKSGNLEQPPRVPLRRHSKSKRNMTLELLVSDVHVGKKTETYNYEVCVSRMRQLVEAVRGEVDRYSQLYNIDRIIVAMLGDMIENFEMHGLESARGCEFGNSEQTQKAIEVLYTELLVPLSQLGVKLTVIGVAGNHDRTDGVRSYHNVGKTYLTHVIYKTLEMLCSAAKIRNIEFHIPTGPYHVESIYGNNCLFEHGDLSRACTEEALERLLNRRQTQVGRVIHFMRVGHYHHYACFGRGRIIVNESLPGADSFSDALGFDSQAGQVLNFYIETASRPTCFYKSFPIYLQ